MQMMSSDNDTNLSTNLKWVLTSFEQVSIMRINYSKSEVIPLCLDDNETTVFAKILGCDGGSLPIEYLGISLYYEKLIREDVLPLIDKNVKSNSWLERQAYFLCWPTLIKTSLASITVHLLSFFKFPKWDLHLIKTHMDNCI
jgi:hypothetical protein